MKVFLFLLFSYFEAQSLAMIENSGIRALRRNGMK